LLDLSCIEKRGKQKQIKTANSQNIKLSRVVSITIPNLYLF